MSLLKRVVRAGLGLLGSVVVLLLGAVILGVMSERGSRLTATVLADLSGGALQFEHFDGRLAGAFEMQGLRLVLPDLSFRCEHVEFAWIPSALFEGVLRVRRIALRRPVLEIPETGEAQAEPLRLPSLPVAVVLDELETDQATFMKGEEPVELESLSASAEWRADRIAIGRLEVRYGPHSLKGHVGLDIRHEPRVAVRLEWTGPVADVASTATVSVVGPVIEAELNGEFDSLAAGRLGGTIALIPEQPRIDISGTLDPISIPVSDEGPADVTQITFAVAGGLEQLQIETTERIAFPSGPNFDLASNIIVSAENRDYSSIAAVFDWRAAPLGEGAPGPLTGRGELGLKDGVLKLDHRTGFPYRSEVVAKLAADPVKPMLEATIAWSDITLRLNDELVIGSPAGTASLSGVLPDLDIAVNTSLDESRLGRSELELRGHVNRQALQLDALSAMSLGGEIKANGRMDWMPALGGRFSVSGDGIDLGRLRPETPTRLRFDTDIAIEQTSTGLATDVRVADLSGAWRGHAVTGKGRLRIEPGTVTVDAFDLSAGENALFVTGRLSDRIDGSFKLALPDLSVFDQKLSGEVTGSGRFSGDRSAPAIVATIAGRRIAWDTIGVASLSAETDVDLSRDLNSSLSIRANSIDYETLHIDSAVVGARGTKRSHAIDLDIDGADARVRAAVKGGWSGSVWDATVLEQDIDVAPIGRWTLSTPARLRVTAAKEIGLTGMCLVQDAGRICADEARWSADSGSAEVNYTKVPLSTLDHWLPAHIRARGTVSGDLAVAAEADALTVTGRTEMDDATILVSGYGDLVKNLPIEGFTARYEMSPRTYRAEFSATIPDFVTVHADADVDRRANDALRADLDFDSRDLSWLGDLFPALHGTSGAFGLKATVGGTLTAPDLQARGRLGSGQIVVPDIGLHLGQLEFAADTHDQRTVKFSGRTAAGQKEVRLEGRITLDPEQGWPYRVSARGDDFPLVRLPEMEVDISPDVTLEAERGTVHASGRIVIPHLYFELLALPETATAVSEDQVLIAPDGEPIGQDEAKDAPLVYYRERLSGDLELVLGDDVEIKGLGLTTGLTGDVRLNKTRGQLGQAEGKVTVKGGVFKAYGQKLTIEKGHLLFAGPVDNPSLDIRAVRPNISVVAGVRITGTAQDPRIDIFSEPPMSDAEKLSYILTGRSMADASKGDAALITQAALGFGLEHSSVITNEVRDLFQLDELGLSGGETVADTAVVAGKQISPRLSVRSEMNLFDQLWSFFLRYKLTDSWSVEAESGVRQGADLIYSIERNSLLGGSR